MSVIGLFPGSFDPIHNGHVDLVRRSRPLFGELVVAVLNNENKKPTFALDERIEMLNELFAEDPGIRVESFSGLLVEFARQIGASYIVRGLRTGTDLDYELPMTLMNRRLEGDVATLFLFPASEYQDLSSSLIKEVFRLGGRPEGLLPEAVERRLIERFSD